MVFESVRTTALLVFVYSTSMDSMTPFSAVFTLQYSRVHTGALEHGYMAMKVEAPVDKSFCLCATLRVPDINPYDGYIRFGQYSDYMGA